VSDPAAPYKFAFPQPTMELARADFQPPPEAPGDLDPQLARLADELDRAALDPSAWVELLKQLADLFDATCGHVALYDFQSGRILLHSLASEQFAIPYEVLEAYEQVAPFDPRSGLAACFPGRTITHEDIDPDKLAALPVVQMAPDELAQMMTLCDVQDPFWGFLSVLRHRDAPAFTRAERARMTGLATALARSMALFRVKELQAQEGRQIQVGLLDSMSFPAGLFTGDGVCMGLNAAARSRLAVKSPGAWPSVFGWSAACREAAQTGMKEVTLATPDGPAPGRLARLHGVHPLLMLEVDFDAASATVRADRFCVSHGLTQAERAILQLLSLGKSLSEVADLRSTSTETVRAQMRSIREKTGLHTQRELIAAITGVQGGAR
jgi:DNA-binding CsgD family transcriptional regulator